MQPTSYSQFDAVAANTIPPLEIVRPGIWALPLDMPESIPFSLCYLFLGDAGDVAIIDPGWNSDGNWQRMTQALEQLGTSITQVTTVVVTHLHPDHLGMAGRVRTASAAVVALHRIEQDALDEMSGNFVPATQVQFDAWEVPTERRAEIADARHGRHDYPAFTADRLLDDGEQVVLAGHALIVHRTPGHTSGHICLELGSAGLIFTGDHVLPTIYSGIGLGGKTASNPLADYLEALDELVALEQSSAFEQSEVCPGHGYRFRGLALRCAELTEHHLLRTREVAAILTATPDASVYAIASALTWTAGWANLRGFYLQSALFQTAMHAEYGATPAGRARLSRS